MYSVRVRRRPPPKPRGPQHRTMHDYEGEENEHDQQVEEEE